MVSSKIQPFTSSFYNTHQRLMIDVIMFLVNLIRCFIWILTTPILFKKLSVNKILRKLVTSIYKVNLGTKRSSREFL